MALLRFTEYFGTLNTDRLTSGSGSTTFGLNGDDVISSSQFSEYNFLAGGSGNDTYNVGFGSATTIVDTGGVDRIVAPSLGFNDSNTYVATVDGGRHILVGSLANGTQLAVANWLSPSNSIESITLADGTYSISFIQSLLYSRPNFIGDVSISQLVSSGRLPTGTTSSDLLEFINYVALREAQKTSELNSPKLPASTTLESKLSVIVSPGVISSGPLYLQNLNEKFVYENSVLISHIVEYGGAVFNYADIDSLIITVTRDGEFTQEFANEISDYAPAAVGITYQAAVQLLGIQNIDSVIISVAGSDGSYTS